MKIAIVGAGKLGMKVTNALAGGNHSITIIDKKRSDHQSHFPSVRRTDRRRRCQAGQPAQTQ